VKSGYASTDFLIAFSPIYLENPNAILFKPPIDSVMSDDGAAEFRSRTLDLTFLGKGSKYTDCFLVDGTVELSKGWPRTKAELASLLRSTRYLYTWDCHSAVNMDAIFCGARLVLMQTRQAQVDVMPVDQNYLSLMIPVESFNSASPCVGMADYEVRRLEFLKDIREQVNRWALNVEETVHRMSIFFSL
jgi:hypothetical protein